MGFWDELLGKGKKKAATVAARQAVQAASTAVEEMADGLLGAAEKELEAAQTAREGRKDWAGPALKTAPPEIQPAATPPTAPPEEAPAAPPGLEPEEATEELSPVEAEALRVAAREARARDELVAMKAAMARGESLPQGPAPREVVEPPSVRARHEREDRAREELEALKKLHRGDDGSEGGEPGGAGPVG